MAKSSDVLRWMPLVAAAAILAAGCGGGGGGGGGGPIDSGAQARSVCHTWRNIPVPEASPSLRPALRQQLRELSLSASRAAADDPRWRPLANAVSDTTSAVAAAGRPGADQFALVTRLKNNEQVLLKACTAADPQDGWGTSVYIPSGAMEPTIRVGDWVSYDKPRSIADIRRGSIVVFNGPRSWTFGASERFIKRVIAVGGDHVICCDPHGDLTVNGVPLHEGYIYAGAKPSDQHFAVRVPRGYLWVMGDHRDFSADSRSHMSDPHQGCIPARDVVGIVTRISAPSARARPIPTPTYNGL
jgi:signal peptidase I